MILKKYFNTLNLVNTKNVVISYRVKHSDDRYKYFIGSAHEDGVIRPLCVILPQMSGYIKYFKTGGKSMSFKIEEESEEYIKTKVKTFNDTINTLFSGDEIPKERIN